MALAIRAAYPEDRELILPLLTKLNPDVAWGPLFSRYWNVAEDWIGYVAEADGRAVGFLGVIFSRRVIDGKELKFCNTTSWIVDEEFRMCSLALLGAVMRLRDYQIINLSASEAVCQIVSKLGFKKLDSALCICPAVPSAKGFIRGMSIKIIQEAGNVRGHLNQDDRRKCDDHISTSCQHILLMDGTCYCYLVGSRIIKFGMPFFRIHYISNVDILARTIGWIRLRLCFMAGAIALVFDERFLKEYKIQLSLRHELPWQRLYKGDAISPDELDNLYSEYTVLRI